MSPRGAGYLFGSDVVTQVSVIVVSYCLSVWLMVNEGITLNVIFQICSRSQLAISTLLLIQIMT